MSKKISFQDVRFRNLKVVCKSDLWDELSGHQKDRVREAQSELSQGKGKSHQEVMRKYKRWFR